MTPADVAESMVPVACDLACLVRDGDREGIAAFLAALRPGDTGPLLIVLAAMIPVDTAGPAELLAWTDEQPCGTYAAARRHERRGEPLDPECDLARRSYYAHRYQTRKSRAQETVRAA